MFTAVLGRGGTIPLGYQFETALQMHAWQDLAGIGAPVRVFLLSDLLREDFPVGDIRLAVFLNAFMLNGDLRHAVKAKLQTDGRTVAWIFAPGLLDADACTDGGSCTPSAATASELVGLPLAMHDTEAALATTFLSHTKGNGPIITPPLAGSSYGSALGTVSPWLSCADGSNSDESLLVLGRYSQGGDGSKAAICYRFNGNTASNHSAVFIGAPRPPLAFWRSLAVSAGVFVYTDEVGTDDDTVNHYADTVEVCVELCPLDHALAPHLRCCRFVVGCWFV